MVKLLTHFVQSMIKTKKMNRTYLLYVTAKTSSSYGGLLYFQNVYTYVSC
jgi:hypothetical protein